MYFSIVCDTDDEIRVGLSKVDYLTLVDYTIPKIFPVPAADIAALGISFEGFLHYSGVYVNLPTGDTIYNKNLIVIPFRDDTTLGRVGRRFNDGAAYKLKYQYSTNIEIMKPVFYVITRLGEIRKINFVNGKAHLKFCIH